MPRTASREDTFARKVAFLGSVSLFADLRRKDLETLANDFRLREYGKGETIFHQGDDSRELYVVVRGKVRVFRTSPSGNETSVCIFAAHDVIGEFAPVDHRPRSATAKTVEPCALLATTGDTFLQRMHEMPGLAIGMARLLVDKMRWTAAYAEAIAQYDAAGRLLHLLLLYNEQFGEEVEEGKRYELDLSLNQTDLASMVGASRGWINRKLGKWRERGLIEYKAGKIVILDLPAVEKERDLKIVDYSDETKW